MGATPLDAKSAPNSDHDERGRLRVEVSHPFARNKRKDGARNILEDPGRFISAVTRRHKS
jgi:hypothetical protein